MRTGFLTAGTFCLDRNITVDSWPREDMAITARGITLAGGGSACNFAIDMKKLDPSVPVAVQALVGAGGNGDFLISEAARHGVETSGMRRSDQAPTQVSDAYHSADTGRRTHILFEGTGALLCPDHFDFSTTNARFLHLGLPGIHAAMDAPWGNDPNGWVTVLKAAQAAGLETNLELVSTSAEALRKAILPCLPYLTTLICNDFEIGALAGMDTLPGGETDLAAVEAAARKVLAQGAMVLVAVHFTSGALLVDREGAKVFVPSVNVPPSEHRGANGAGDAFCAGFFYGRHMGWGYEDCLRMGHATSAACLRAPGTYDTVGTAEDNLALAARWGWRG